MDRLIDSIKRLTLHPVAGRQWVALLAVIAVFLWLYFFLAAILIAETNQNRLKSDQQHNINLSLKSVGHVYPYYTDGLVGPLWPWLASKFRSDDDAVTFVRGKWLNVSLSAVFLVGMTFAAARFLPLLPTVNLLLLAGLGGLLNRAVFFQPEPLSYMLLAGCWLGALLLLHRNPLWLYALLGGMAGVAYLAKTSVSPMLMVFIGVSGLQWLWMVFLGRRDKNDPSQQARGTLSLQKTWSWQRHLGGLILLAICFSLPVIPRAVYSQHQFGTPLHSWPKYWMWQDDFGKESVPFMANHGNKQKLAALTPEETPSARNYFASHSGEVAWQRLLSGVDYRLQEFFLPEKIIKRHKTGKPWKQVLRYRGGYLLIAGLLVVTLTVGALRSRWREFLSPPVLSQVLFVVGAFALYTLAYGWYYQIGRGERFMMALFVPVMATLLWAGDRLCKSAPCQHSKWIFSIAHVMILALLLDRIVDLLASPIFAG